MLGGMEDEVLDPSGGMWEIDGLDVIWGGIEKVVLLDANRGFDGAEKWVVVTDVDGILEVGWDVVCTNGWVRVGWLLWGMGTNT